MYFAGNEKQKNMVKRYWTFLEITGKKVILEIDSPVDAITTKRKYFYERSGFSENPYPYIHLPYHKKKTGHDLVIMSYPNKITQNICRKFKKRH